MSSSFQLFSLDVGQGMCTLFAVYDQNGAVTGLALFDLGSAGKKDIAGPPTLEFLKNMALARESPNGRIDAVFISHKDKDHVNLFTGGDNAADPLAGLLQLLPNMAVGRVRYGGRYSWYADTAIVAGQKENLLTVLKGRTANPDLDVTGFPVGATTFSSTHGQGVLWGGEDYSVFLLAGNTPYKGEAFNTAEDQISAQPNGDQANSKSLVLIVAIYWGGVPYTAVITGDATFPTFQYITSFTSGTLPATYMSLLPHHGSRKTTFGLSGKNKVIAPEVRAVVEAYAQFVASKTLIASADTGEKYGHPSYETSQIFLAYADTTKSWWTDPQIGASHHFTTAYIDFALDSATYAQTGMKTILTSQNLYSTRYYDSTTVSSPMVAFAPFSSFTQPPYPTTAAFAPGMNWIYTLFPQPSFLWVGFEGVSSNRLPSSRSLAAMSVERLREALPFVHRYGDAQTEPPPTTAAPAASPRPHPQAAGAGAARAPARPQRFAPRLSGPGPRSGGRT